MSSPQMTRMLGFRGDCACAGLAPSVMSKTPSTAARTVVARDDKRVMSLVLLWPMAMILAMLGSDRLLSAAASAGAITPADCCLAARPGREAATAVVGADDGEDAPLVTAGDPDRALPLHAAHPGAHGERLDHFSGE